MGDEIDSYCKAVLFDTVNMCIYYVHYTVYIQYVHVCIYTVYINAQISLRTYRQNKSVKPYVFIHCHIVWGLLEMSFICLVVAVGKATLLFS